MHSIYKLIRGTHIPKLLPLTIKRNCNSKPARRLHKTNFFLILTGVALASYYYICVVPKWINRRVSFQQSDSENVGVINNEDIKLQLESNLNKADGGSAKQKYNFVDKVVQKCAPGVFHILITTTKPKSLQSADISPFVYGSGFVISEDGWAITNAHVVLNKDSYISCKMSDGTIYSAEIVDIDVNIDVALLKLHANKPLTALPLEQPGVVDVGEWVVALGSPLSLSNSISVGVVSSINRSARELGLKNYSMSYIQTDALITFGNSGGPLVNLDGKVIGISSLRLTSGISFAIPVEYCRKFLQNSKTFNPSYSPEAKTEDDQMTLFGLTTISITSEMLIDLMKKKLLTTPQGVDQGLLIWKVLDGSIAKEVGLSAGDIITHIDGVPVKDAMDLYSKSRRKINDEYVQLVVVKKSTQEETLVAIPIDKIVNSEA